MPIIPDREKAPILIRELENRPNRVLRLAHPNGDVRAYVTAEDDRFVITFSRDGETIATDDSSKAAVRRLILTWQPEGIRPVSETPIEWN